MIELMFVGDIVENNGLTVKVNNFKIKHNIPIGSLVEVKYDEWHGNGCCKKVHARLFVIEQNRDCDGTPLYYLSHINKQVKDYLPEYNIGNLFKRQMMDIIGGFTEGELTVIDITDDIKSGADSLRWG
jgi:hypothetical protein